MKKITVFGGGTGLSCLLSGLKLFPVDVTTVITVTDNGSSTGKLKEELDIPAVGDIGKVLLAMANADEDFIRLMSYRFSKAGSLENHPVRNILLAALIDLKGSLSEAARYMCSLLEVKGTVLPLTEEKVELVGKSSDRDYFGEEEVSANIRHIRRLAYDHDIQVSKEPGITQHEPFENNKYDLKNQGNHGEYQIQAELTFVDSKTVKPRQDHKNSGKDHKPGIKDEYVIIIRIMYQIDTVLVPASVIAIVVYASISHNQKCVLPAAGKI